MTDALIERCCAEIEAMEDGFIPPDLAKLATIAVLRASGHAELVAALNTIRNDVLGKIRRYADDHDDEMVPMFIDEALVIIDAALAAAGHLQNGAKP